VTDISTIQVPFLRNASTSRALAAIFALSAGVCGFLIWLVKFKPAAGYVSDVIGYLPALNSAFNATASVFLISGFVAVKRRNYVRHVWMMGGALLSSTLFLISYIVYHYFHGDTKFTGTGMVRPIYFFILISHISLSMVVVPLILISLYLSLSGKLALHRRVSRFTFPIWLYVSVTGVLIFVFLRLFSR
jgi:putative membrane protein